MIFSINTYASKSTNDNSCNLVFDNQKNLFQLQDQSRISLHDSLTLILENLQILKNKPVFNRIKQKHEFMLIQIKQQIPLLKKSCYTRKISELDILHKQVFN
jgi:hypothetical protein